MQLLKCNKSSSVWLLSHLMPRLYTCVHVAHVAAAGLSGWQTPVMLQPPHPQIKYDSRDLTVRISLVFLEYHGMSLYVSLQKQQISPSKRQQQWLCCYLPQLIQVFEDLLLAGDDGAQLLLPCRIQLKDKYNIKVWRLNTAVLTFDKDAIKMVY